MHQIGAGRSLDQLADEMKIGADAGRREREAAAGFTRHQQLLEAVDLQGRRSGDHIDDAAEQRHRQQRRRILTLVLVEVADDRLGIERTKEQRIAVAFRGRGKFGSDQSARADAVVDDHRLSQPRGQLVAEQARDHIGGRAGGIRDHQRDRPRRPVLRRRRNRHQQRQHSGK